jgi:hypothetical protein
VQDIDITLVQHKRQMHVSVERAGFGRIVEELEVFREWIELVQVRMLADQEVFGIAVGAGKLVNDVANIRAESEIAGAPDIDGNTHRRARLARGVAAPCQSRRNVPAARVQRELHGKVRDLCPDALLALGIAQMR